ncbi:hypothetical protein [Paenibacillus campi]|uniref:hypothetical protein n=1 Tax=Paenibacillus campi TaxID=3106031 RepID=UPI002AFF6372|nr:MULTISPECIES: hypothetical protein [unclassified Paenibacillus]
MSTHPHIHDDQHGALPTYPSTKRLRLVSCASFTRLLAIVGVMLLLCTAYASFIPSANADAKSNTYTAVSLYVNGELQIMPQLAQLLNGDTLYIPVKQLDRIPGITVNYGSPLRLTGSRSHATVNSTNSFVYAGTTYVKYKTLLAISELDGRYAASASTLFVWTTDKGKAASAKILDNISQLPAGAGTLIGQKIYPFHESGSYWVTDVTYDPDSTIYYVTARNSGAQEIHLNSNYAAFEFVLASALSQFQDRLRGKTVWYDNRTIQVEKINHLDKLVFVGFKIEDDNTIRAIVRKTNGNLYAFELEPHYEVVDMLNERLFTTNPRSVYKWSNKVWDAITANEVFVGMTHEQVILSWGVPSDYNTYQSANLTYEQWIYAHNYLYFWNGKLSSAQSF